MRRLWILLGVLWILSTSVFLSGEELGLRVPDGFDVSLYAGDDLAHDIFSMTIDSHGRVVVAGAGYVKILHDDNADGRADRATLFSKLPASGAHGMCFDGDDLICTGDNALLRIRDINGDGVADGEPQVLASLRHPEHGANGVVHGPDGWFYVICGNDAGVSEKHVTTKSSPVKNPQCGAVLRVSPDGKQQEVVAHGFRNPYDLAFGVDGTMFTVDADGERDQHLPWYSPTRLFDIAPGMHHGWMLQGWQKSWNRPPWFPDNVERLNEIGRGSPTGLIVYRHRQFPENYRGNVFSCCWTLGRIYHFPLERQGSTFRAKREIFLETTGDIGFAPVDLAVGPSGDLFVAIGGRRTRGSVFRVSYKDGSLPEGKRSTQLARSQLSQVLAADEPLSAWSRAKWVPEAKKLDPKWLQRAIYDDSLTVAERVRAVEILTELFDGMELVTIETNLRRESLAGVTDDPGKPGEFLAVKNSMVMARIAWSIGRHERIRKRIIKGLNVYVDDYDALLSLTSWPDDLTRWPYLGQSNVMVQRQAWEALAVMPSFRNPQFATAFSKSKDSTDHRLRFARLLADARQRPAVPAQPESNQVRDILDWLWQLHFRSKLEITHTRQIIDLFRSVTDEAQFLEAIRLAELAFGDIETSDANPDVLPGYALRGDVESQRSWIKSLTATRLGFPDEVREVDLELARLCGMLGISDPLLPARLMRQCTADSPVPDDLHYLLVLALLDTPRDESTTAKTADVLIRLAGKMELGKLYPSRNWPLRVAEMFARLCKRDERLAEAIYTHAQFGHVQHSLFVPHMPELHRAEAARRLLCAIGMAGADWTPDIIEMVALLPSAEAHPLLREHWDNFAIRDPIVQVLARHPDPIDRERFGASLMSAQPAIVEAAAAALAQLQVQPTNDEWLAVMKSLRRFVSAPQNESVRVALARLLSRWSGGEVPEQPAANKNPRDAYAAHLAWFARQHPQLAERLSSWSDDAAAWRGRLAKVNWDQGDAQRGRLVFEKRACHRCHSGSGPLGPDLAGIASRMSRDDLFAHIIDPNKEVSPAYQTTQVVTGSGRIVVGLIVYESPESTLVQTGPDTTVRIAGEEIVSMTKSNQSLMPVGLLNDVTTEELADLNAYLQTLQSK